MAVFSGQVGDRCKHVRVKRKTTMDKAAEARGGPGEEEACSIVQCMTKPRPSQELPPAQDSTKPRTGGGSSQGRPNQLSLQKPSLLDRAPTHYDAATLLNTLLLWFKSPLCFQHSLLGEQSTSRGLSPPPEGRLFKFFQEFTA